MNNGRFDLKRKLAFVAALAFVPIVASPAGYFFVSAPIPSLAICSSSKYDRAPLVTELILVFASEVLLFLIYCINPGIATAARIPMMATTIMSSMSVKPLPRGEFEG